MKRISIITLALLFYTATYAQKPRARDLGVPFDGTPGKLNAITDVLGVEVGHSTIISGKDEHIIGKGPVRTGVTAIFPRGKSKKFSPICQLVQPERKRRNDRHHLAHGIWIFRNSNYDYEYQ